MESGFRIHNILLLESNFKRVSNVLFNDPAITQDIRIEGEVTVNPEKNIVSVIQTLHFSQIYKEEIQIAVTIKMIGIFEKTGESVIDLEDFGKVNGAAIIYPYIREHLSSLSIKAGVGIILLPPANFTTNNK
jgi:preprotein translocase subunit SecB